MFTTVFFVSVLFSQKNWVNSKPAEPNKPGLSVNEETIYNVQQKMAMQFPKGIVPYYIDLGSYDSIIIKRIKKAMDVIEASSCVVFQQIPFTPSGATNGSWVHFTNPSDKRNCVHQPVFGENREIMIVIGFDCMTSSRILHAVLHAIGFKDEVGHPHRDQYIKIIWENIQPEYRTLFHIQPEDDPYRIVEYDPMSVMHFQDRAFSMNGGPTIIPRIPGLTIAPSDKLSQLDVMKLRLWFGHECNKRKIGALLDKCKIVFANNAGALAGLSDAEQPKESVEADNIDDDDDYYQNYNTADYFNEYDSVGNSGIDNGGGDYGDDDKGGGDNGAGDKGGGDYDGDDNGGDDNGAGDNGAGDNGEGDNGAGVNGAGDDGAGDNVAGDNRAGDNGAGVNGAGDNGAGVNGSGDDGGDDNGAGDNGAGDNVAGDNGAGDNGTGDDGGDDDGDDSKNSDNTNINEKKDDEASDNGKNGGEGDNGNTNGDGEANKVEEGGKVDKGNANSYEDDNGDENSYDDDDYTYDDYTNEI